MHVGWRELEAKLRLEKVVPHVLALVRRVGDPVDETQLTKPIYIWVFVPGLPPLGLGYAHLARNSATSSSEGTLSRTGQTKPQRRASREIR